MSRSRQAQAAPSLIHLLHRASQAAEARYHAAAPDIELTPRQLVVLDAIASLEDPSQTEICRASGIDRSTLADIVGRLVDRRLLSRRRTRADARRYALRLTVDGSALLAHHKPHLDRVDRELVSDLTSRERDVLFAVLSRVAADRGIDDDFGETR
jgi:DNA-binding MarR family transcriptional regulator